MSHQLKKINRYAIDWSKEKKHRKLPLSYKYKKCSILSRAKQLQTLFRESGSNLQQFRLSISPRYLIPTSYPDEPLWRNCSWLVPDSRNNLCIYMCVCLYVCVCARVVMYLCECVFVYIYKPLCQGKNQHKIILFSELNWFNFSVFLLQDWLSKKVERVESIFPQVKEDIGIIPSPRVLVR